MPDAISFPMRIAPSGRMAVVQQNSDAQFGELLTALVLTEPGERDLVPSFGIADPSFTGFDRVRLGLQIQMFGPPVTVTNVDVAQRTATIQDVRIEFT